MRLLAVFILLSISGAEAVQLLDAHGKHLPPKDLQSNVSWIGLLVLEDGKKSEACTAAHIEGNQITVHESCLPREKNQKATLHFWDKKGVEQHSSVALLPSPGNEASPIRVVEIPSTISENWATAGKTPRKDERWFGGFNPEWELIRVYSFETTSNPATFQFQVNTCKASSQSPLLKLVKSIPDDEEEVLNEIPLIPKKKDLESFKVVEKCIRPLTHTTPGALITLAKDFSQKFGFMVQKSFPGLNHRQIASLKTPTEKTMLRYIGADGLESGVPANPSSVQLNLSYDFKNLFPPPLDSGF